MQILQSNVLDLTNACLTWVADEVEKALPYLTSVNDDLLRCIESFLQRVRRNEQAADFVFVEKAIVASPESVRNKQIRSMLQRTVLNYIEGTGEAGINLAYLTSVNGDQLRCIENCLQTVRQNKVLVAYLHSERMNRFGPKPHFAVGSACGWTLIGV
ncbi:unnamed protein product [Dibothriocephalus latus]|uniref:Uncharacterized protein n=1 Tax=Dibothriocephalus latus TaxID=60516 RepID=A0A3P7P737_DIBLA|nr:unnamed protein product [Dibothriocephalus latus]